MKKNVKLGLALGSGGAKGMAHVGCLYALQKMGIKFDIIAGTSIGSIVGGMYAKGFSPVDMKELVVELNLSSFESLIFAKLKSKTLPQILKNLIGDYKFSDLKLPFTAVATDIYNGEEVRMTQGDLTLAMACSSSMPPAFKPIKREERYLIDGAFTNNVPADVVRSNGADYVLAINLGVGNDTNIYGKQIIDRLYPNNKVQLKNRSIAGYTNSNIMLEPNLSKYRGFSVGGMENMFYCGYDHVIEREKEIIKALNL